MLSKGEKISKSLHKFYATEKGKETREKISKSKLGKKRFDVKIRMTGKTHPLWRGADVSCNALHAWVKRHKPKTLSCENCRQKSPLDLANISGEYKRDITDYQWLCRRCHMLLDGRLEELKKRITEANKSGLTNEYKWGKR